MTDNSIINKEDALRGLLSNEHYFQTLLESLYSNKILGIENINRIQFQVLNILTETVGYYTKKESSSVREEIALQLTSSIYYTVGLSLKSQSNLKEAIAMLQKEDIKDIFAQGEEILKEKIDKCKNLHEAVIETRLHTKNQAYTDTIDYGIPLFFKEYDMRFASHETPGSIDYPLAISNEDMTGIEYIEDYLNKLVFENKVCSFFDDKEIDALLIGYTDHSDEMLINIYKLVLTNFLGCILAEKTGNSLDIRDEERKYLKSILSNLSSEEFENVMSTSQEKLCQELGIEDEEHIRYVSRTLEIISKEIKRHLDMDTLENLFITLRWQDNKKVKFEDGESLTDGAFMEMTDKIRDCSDVKDKIDIIKEELRSMKDLMDVFTADCIFDDEFIDIFSILGDFEIALLTKYISDEMDWDSDYTEDEKEWQTELKRYFETFGEEKRAHILRMADQIEL